MKDLSNPTVFNDANENYYDFVLSASLRRKQISPFIVITKDGYMGIEYLEDLIKLDESFVVLQAWPGRYRTDVFKSTVGKIKKQVLLKG